MRFNSSADWKQVIQESVPVRKIDSSSLRVCRKQINSNAECDDKWRTWGHLHCWNSSLECIWSYQHRRTLSHSRSIWWHFGNESLQNRQTMNLRHCKSAPMIANLCFTGYDLIKKLFNRRRLANRVCFWSVTRFVSSPSNAFLFKLIEESELRSTVTHPHTAMQSYSPKRHYEYI